MARNGKLTPTQRRAVAALLTQRDTRAAAELARVGERTLHRWLNTDSFKAALREAESAAIDATVRRLSELTGQAVETLRDEMGNMEAAPASRVRAADIVLSRLIDLRRLHEIDSRLAALEKAIGNAQ